MSFSWNAAAEAEARLDRKDRERRAHCLHYTGQEWGQADDYHLVVSFDLLGIEETAEAIFRIVGRKRDEAAVQA